MMKIINITILILLVGLTMSYGAVEYTATARIHIPIELLPTDTDMVPIFLANQKILITSSDNIQRSRKLLEDQADRLTKEFISLSVRTVDDSSTIDVQCKATGPVICAEYANAVAEAYITWHQNTHTNLNIHPMLIQKAIPAGPPKSTFERMFKSIP